MIPPRFLLIPNVAVHQPSRCVPLTAGLRMLLSPEDSAMQTNAMVEAKLESHVHDVPGSPGGGGGAASGGGGGDADVVAEAPACWAIHCW